LGLKWDDKSDENRRVKRTDCLQQIWNLCMKDFRLPSWTSKGYSRTGRRLYRWMSKMSPACVLPPVLLWPWFSTAVQDHVVSHFFRRMGFEFH
jgi:hypothetical protein